MAEKMSAAEAVRFEHYSQTNALIVESSFACDCQAYEDVFTYRRWLAQGMQVQRGEKAIKITTYRPIMDEDTGEVVGRAPTTSAVFCRHQVKESGK
jgi:hypothetical protein